MTGPARGTDRQKHADLASSGGAGVLGAGLGALLADWAAPYAMALLALGALLHGWGMLEKRRLDAGAALPLWSRSLYWLCWIVLAALMVWMGFHALRR
jgi:hypothetical protein